ncbi:MAG: FAD-dependent oxidoreductase, partial [Dongiaceae bacterium]
MQAKKPSPSLPRSLWAATAAPAVAAPPLAADTSTDIVVIGAGFVGLNAALRLLERGRGVIVLDAAEPGWGASGRNGGQVIAGLKHNPDLLDEIFGRELGTRMTAAFGGAADQVFGLIERHGIDCQTRRAGWIYAAHGRKPFETLVQPRARQWQARGADGMLLSGDALCRELGCAAGTYAGGWLDRRGGVLQPLSYCRGLAKAVIAAGGILHGHSPAHRLTQSAEGWIVEAGAFKIAAGKVVLATN